MKPTAKRSRRKKGPKGVAVRRKPGKRPASKTPPPPEDDRPLWARPQPEGPVWPALDEQLAKPFLQQVRIDPSTGCIRCPASDTPMGGLHRCMRQRFFRNQAPPEYAVRSGTPLRKCSSKQEGSRADAALDAAIESGQAPPDAGRRGASIYASGVWQWWRENGHRPVLSQLPVVIPHAWVATAGDYFTVHTCPLTGTETLWLWELKTGWPQTQKSPNAMSAPLDHVWITPDNRWLLQLCLTREAYRRELKLEVPLSRCRVIQAYQERPRCKNGPYECKVRILDPSVPGEWPAYTDMDAVYSALKKEVKRAPKKKKKNQ